MLPLFSWKKCHFSLLVEDIFSPDSSWCSSRVQNKILECWFFRQTYPTRYWRLMNYSLKFLSFTVSSNGYSVCHASLLNSAYKVWIKGKWRNPGKRVAPSSTAWCSNYWKGSFLVALHYDQPTLYIYIFFYTKTKNTFWDI